MIDPVTLLLVIGVALGLGSLVFWPQKGLLARWQKSRQQTARVLQEDALKHIYKCETNGRSPTLESIAGMLQISTNQTAALLTTMQTGNLIHISADTIRLTADGRASALHIIRAHRLWERYLAEETGFSELDWHGQAETYEHLLTPDEADALAWQLGHPTHDPHGDPIPTASGEMVAHGGRPLTALSSGESGHIVHLEDEPDVVYAQLVAEGLSPGMTIRLIETTPQRIRFWAGGNEHVLALMVANNISVEPLPEPLPEMETSHPNGARLSDLPLGATSQVTRLSPTCRGAERRRFMDLGILPGTAVTAELRSPGGDPTAYKIRGALIALRQDQANLIYIENVIRNA